jgi:hypothetical protein
MHSLTNLVERRYRLGGLIHELQTRRVRPTLRTPQTSPEATRAC